MEWIENLNRAVKYIEDNLEGEISLSSLAKITCCSEYHFQRIFSYIADVPLTEYIRRRRMTKAALDLQNSDIKIIDLALKYGYDSPTAFNRAFQGIHGIAPSKARTQGVILKAYPPVSFTITIKGDSEMKYRIEKKAAFRVVGLKQHFTGGIEESFAEVPKMWGKAHAEGLIPKLCGIMNPQMPGIMGMCTQAPAKEFDYYICVASEAPAGENMEEYEIPEASWAIFECVGAMPDALQNLQKRIVSEWIPTSGYKYANLPDIELYYEGDQNSPDYKCEAWLPVIKA